jgi:AcrR family transcriptional regulator
MAVSGIRGVRRYKDRAKEILEVAAKLFREKGFKATSIQDISDALGLEKGAIYYWVKNKDEILYMLIETEGQMFLNMIRKLMKENINPVEKLKRFIKNHIKIMTENLDKAAVFFSEYKSLPEKWKKKVMIFRDEYENFLRTIIREGQEKREIRKDLDSKLIGFAILGMINWVYIWFSKDGKYSAEEIADTFSEIILSGIAEQTNSKNKN